MRKFHYPGLTAMGFYGVTAMPLVASKGGLTAQQQTTEVLCRVMGDGTPRLEWTQLHSMQTPTS